MEDFETNIVNLSISIFETIKKLQSSTLKTCFIVDEENRVVGTVTDGDIRRGILKGINLQEKICSIMNRNFQFLLEGDDLEKLGESLKKIGEKNIVIPVLNQNGKLVRAFLSGDINKAKKIPNKAFILAGGLGSRLGDLTKDTPKPMLHVGGRPILQIILEGLKEHGLEEVYISVNYQSHIIENYFGDGSSFGLKISYIRESSPLGTAGSLSLIEEELGDPLLIMNGDLLTSINFSCLIDFFNETQADALICVREYDFEVPFGVVKTENDKVVSIEEKPVKKFLVNAGVYLISPECLKYVNNGEFLNMPKLLERIGKYHHKVSAFPINEYWLDIGRLEDFKRANKEFTHSNKV